MPIFQPVRTSARKKADSNKLTTTRSSEKYKLKVSKEEEKQSYDPSFDCWDGGEQ